MLRKLRALGQQVFAVVEHQQQLPVAHIVDQRVDHRPPHVILDAQDRSHGLRHEALVGDRRQLNEPHTIRIFIDDVGGDLQRQPRLADPADSTECQEPRFLEGCLDFLLLALAANERRDLLRQVIRNRLQRSQCREIRTQLRMLDLIDVLGARQIAQANATEIAQRHAVGQPVPNKVGDSLRNQHLPTVRRTHDPCGTIDGAAEVITVTPFDHARVHAATHAQDKSVAAAGCVERNLECNGRRHCVAGIRERCVHAIPGGFHDNAVIALHGVARDPVMAEQRVPHALRLLLP